MTSASGAGDLPALVTVSTGPSDAAADADGGFAARSAGGGAGHERASRRLELGGKRAPGRLAGRRPASASQAAARARGGGAGDGPGMIVFLIKGGFTNHPLGLSKNYKY